MGSGSSKSKSYSALGYSSLDNYNSVVVGGLVTLEKFTDAPPYIRQDFLMDEKKLFDLIQSNDKKLLNPPWQRALMNVQTILEHAPNVESMKSSHSSGAWANGIGYGGSGDSSFHLSVDYLQKMQDMESLLVRHLAFLTSELPKRVSSQSGKLLRHLKKSQLLAFCQDSLNNDSILDIAKHANLYYYVWNFLISIAQLKETSVLVFDSGLHRLMVRMIRTAVAYQKTKKSLAVAKKAPDSIEDRLVHEVAGSRRTLRRAKVKYLERMEEEKKKEKGGKEKENEKTDNDNAKNKNKSKSKSKSKKSKHKRKSKKTSPELAPEELYVKRLKKLTFSSVEMKEHHYKHQAVSEFSSSQISRIITEFQTLSECLPTAVNPSTSIFVRTDENSLGLIKAMIVGPKGTPYENGLFEFDIQLPAGYPAGPPNCWLMTTGNGTFRFNPNLYANGKVCLSLLGTWSGSQEEKWNPATSSLWQLFLSIQSLIFVEEPYYNEPGYQFSKNDAQSDTYNRNIITGTLTNAILYHLKNYKKSVFANVIKKHFMMKQEEIEQHYASHNQNMDTFRGLMEKMREDKD